MDGTVMLNQELCKLASAKMKRIEHWEAKRRSHTTMLANSEKDRAKGLEDLKENHQAELEARTKSFDEMDEGLAK